MLSILSRLLWFVLAGFILGFATSTIWEWYYYRGKRIAMGNRRVLELETELQRKEELIAELNRTIDSNGQRLASETPLHQTRWDQDEVDDETSYTSRREPWSSASALSTPTHDSDIDELPRAASESASRINRRVSDVLPADVPSPERTAKVRQFPRELEESTAPVRTPAQHSPTQHSPTQHSPAASTQDTWENRPSVQPSQEAASTRPVENEPTVEAPAEENNEPLITFRRGPARPHYSEVMLRPQQTPSTPARSEAYRAESLQPQDDRSQSRRFTSEYGDAQPATEPFEEEDTSAVATSGSAYPSNVTETKASSQRSSSADVEEHEEPKSVSPSLETNDGSTSGTKDEAATQVADIESATPQETTAQPTPRSTVRATSSRNPSKSQSRPQSQSSSGGESSVQAESVASSPPSEPDHEEKATEIANYPDDFTQIDGIGPALCRNLYGSGIYTWHQLSQVTKEELDPITKDDKKISGWKRQARALAEKNQRTNAIYSGKTPSVFKEIRALKPGDPQVLYSGGITTFEELAACDPETLKSLFQDVAGGNTKNFSNWIQRAQELQS